MNKFIFSALMATLLTGCAATGWMKPGGDGENAPMMVNDAGRLPDAEVVYIEPARVNVLGEYSSSNSGNTFVNDNNFQSSPGGDMRTGDASGEAAQINWNHANGGPMIKNINHFVRGIMHNLVDNIHYINDKTPIGVVSFIFLDGDYKKSNLLGNQIAESFMHEVHQFGIPVIDYKTTDYIRVTETGDFIFSRDFLELKDELPIKYVLAGTLVKHQAGYIVNARIIGLTSKAIVASAQGFIPNAVADAIMPSMGNDGIMLMQGE
jgi:TolB-like protein